MKLVVDAGVTLDLLLNPEGFRHLDGFTLVAPPLMWSEAASALSEAAFRGLISKESAADGVHHLGEISIERLVPDDLYIQAWRVAQALGWAKTYDAEYVALTKILGCRLVTRDARLMRGAGRMVEIVGPTQV